MCRLSSSMVPRPPFLSAAQSRKRLSKNHFAQRHYTLCAVITTILASFPGLPGFFVLRFAFSIIRSASVYYTECKPKNKKRGRPGNEATTIPPQRRKLCACACFLRVNNDITIDQMAVVAHGHRGVKGQIVILSSQEASKIKRENI